MTSPMTGLEELRVIQSGVATFFGRPLVRPEEIGAARCAMVGIPWDEGNAGRNGANMGPRAFRDASSWFLGYDAQRDFDLWEAMPTVDVGDVPVMPPNAERTMDLIAEHVRTVRRQGAIPFSVGGNHALAIGAARGAASTVGRMGYLSIDAHLDTATDWAGETLTSGCPTMRAAEIPNVDPANVVVFGIHGWLNPKDQVQAAAEKGITWYGMEKIEELGIERAIAQAIETASDGVDGLYVSFDLDSVDASAFPGTGTPEPGGFTSRETLKIARLLGRANPIAMDLVEIAPIYDLSGISVRLACGVAMEMLSGVCEA
ncbi:agmatinase family protein [Georgenia sp. AZ-5]|uniref:agmatinase family protein n=1 Tax=Georgenia sp. AZ-5 TaxID=3367526 RepID=UPI003754127D